LPIFSVMLARRAPAHHVISTLAVQRPRCQIPAATIGDPKEEPLRIATQGRIVSPRRFTNAGVPSQAIWLAFAATGIPFTVMGVSFGETGVPWQTLALGDYLVKMGVALAMLVPFRLLLSVTRPQFAGNTVPAADA